MAIKDWIDKWIRGYGNFNSHIFIVYLPDDKIFGVSASSLKWLKNLVNEKKEYSVKYIMTLCEKYVNLYRLFRPEFEPEDEEKFIDSVLKWKI